MNDWKERALRAEAERDAARREERMRAEDQVNAWREVAIVTARAESAEAALAGLREGVQEVIDARGRGDFAALLPKLRALLDREEARDE